MRKLEYPNDCDRGDCEHLKQYIVFLNNDIDRLNKKIETLDTKTSNIWSLVDSWDKKVEFFKRMTEFRKLEGLRLTQEEMIIHFCYEILNMSGRAIGNLLGVTKGTIHNKLKLIEKKKIRKKELDQQKKIKYGRLYPMKKPKRYKKSIFRDM